MLEVLQDWEINIKKVLCFTVDNGANIRLAADLLEVPVVRYLDHTIQNGVTKIENLPEIIELKKRTHAIQHLFSTSKVNNRYLSFIQDIHQNKPSQAWLEKISARLGIKYIAQIHLASLNWVLQFNKRKLIDKAEKIVTICLSKSRFWIQDSKKILKRRTVSLLNPEISERTKQV